MRKGHRLLRVILQRLRIRALLANNFVAHRTYLLLGIAIRLELLDADVDLQAGPLLVLGGDVHPWGEGGPIFERGDLPAEYVDLVAGAVGRVLADLHDLVLQDFYVAEAV